MPVRWRIPLTRVAEGRLRCTSGSDVRGWLLAQVDAAAKPYVPGLVDCCLHGRDRSPADCVLRDADPRLAAQLHTDPVGGLRRPYSVSPVLDDTLSVPATGGGSLSLHIGLVADGLAPFFDAALRQPADPRLGGAAGVLAVVSEDIERVELSWAQLAALPSRTSWRLRLATPMTMRASNGKGESSSFHCLPDPDRVLVRLYRDWTRWSPLPVNPAVDEQAAAVHVGAPTSLEVIETPSEQRDSPSARGRPAEPGAQGTVTYLASKSIAAAAPARELGSLTGLFKLAEFAGLGDRTTVGRGVTRLLD